jgi:hypothetical protein
MRRKEEEKFSNILIGEEYNEHSGENTKGVYWAMLSPILGVSSVEGSIAYFCTSTAECIQATHMFEAFADHNRRYWGLTNTSA